MQQYVPVRLPLITILVHELFIRGEGEVPSQIRVGLLFVASKSIWVQVCAETEEINTNEANVSTISATITRFIPLTNL